MCFKVIQFKDILALKIEEIGSNVKKRLDKIKKKERKPVTKNKYLHTQETIYKLQNLTEHNLQEPNVYC